MIEVQGLTRYYGSFPAVQGASFKIADREIVGFLGLNGAGKSTMLRVLAGLQMPSSGTVMIDGVDATLAPDAMRKRIGFLPEDPPLYREMRVVEFLRWVGQVKGCSRKAVEAELPKVIETCQLVEVADQVIGELSHGFRKRVGIAQAIIHKPSVVILDEPISGLDPRQIVEMRSVVRSLKQWATVLISSHILSEIAQGVDRILVIHKGRIVAEGTEQQLSGALGKGTRLSLVVRGSVPQCEELLGASELVDGYELAPQQVGDTELVGIEVSLRGDEREQLVRELVDGGLGVRSVQDAMGELEQIFLQLTRAAVAPAELASKSLGHAELSGENKREANP
ncbi:MAG: ABC transporter ATP-binding protein [Deltaproteobacteria bacterium]|nr:ABC transporter ATP-binding protein [Nannocystaceae bacterium]